MHSGKSSIAGWKTDPDWRCISYKTWGYSIAMLVYWRVIICYILLLFWHSISRLSFSDLHFFKHYFVDRIINSWCIPTKPSICIYIYIFTQDNSNTTNHCKKGQNANPRRFTKFVVVTISKIDISQSNSQKQPNFLQMFLKNHHFVSSIFRHPWHPITLLET